MIDEMSVFLLIGQSNMAGRGKLDDVPELMHPQVFMFREGRWLPAREPLHTDKPHVAGVGLGMSFALALAEKTGIAPLGLVPCAVGGTPLNQWMPGADLYKNAVTTVKSALVHGTLAGVLWHQGEGDSHNQDDAASYGPRLAKMIQQLRADLSAESVPVIAGELGFFLQHHGGCDYFDLVNEQLREVENIVPGYSCVSARGMQDNGDSVHFNAESLREFGRRYAQKFIEMRRQDT